MRGKELMRKVTCAAVLALLALSMSMIGRLVFAQDLPALSVVPSKATILVGETHAFRAVGKDGRLRHNVRWNISPEHAAKLTVDNDEATVQAEEPSSTVLLTAYAEGDSSVASIEILSGPSLPTGTMMWSVSPLPGCKGTKMTQAVPSANGPDIYVEESCPDGAYVRALTSDGRELWRRKSGADPMVRARPPGRAARDGAHHDFRIPFSECSSGTHPGSCDCRRTAAIRGRRRTFSATRPAKTSSDSTRTSTRS